MYWDRCLFGGDLFARSCLCMRVSTDGLHFKCEAALDGHVDVPQR
jgi:hypothetical protein